MTTAQLIIVCVTVLLLAGIAAITLILTRPLEDDDEAALPPRVGHRVTVHTKQPDDQTLFGVLVGDYEDRIVLEDAEYITALGPNPMPGQQHIATADIAWIDVHALVAIPESAPATSET
jgi:hypothetical protein